MITVKIKCPQVLVCYLPKIPVLTSFLKLGTNLGIIL